MASTLAPLESVLLLKPQEPHLYCLTFYQHSGLLNGHENGSFNPLYYILELLSLTVTDFSAFLQQTSSTKPRNCMVRFLVGQEAEMGQELGLSYHPQSLPCQYLLSPNILYTQRNSTISPKQGHPMKKKSIEI